MYIYLMYIHVFNVQMKFKCTYMVLMEPTSSMQLSAICLACSGLQCFDVCLSEFVWLWLMNKIF